MARPTSYTQELDIEICTRLAIGESLRSICKDESIPDISTVIRWVFTDIEGTEAFRAHYETARQMQAELMADELNDIADDGTNDWMIRKGKGGDDYDVVNTEAIQRSKLRVDTRKWVASRLLSKYNEKRETKLTFDAESQFLEAIKPSHGIPSDRD